MFQSQKRGGETFIEGREVPSNIQNAPSATPLLQKGDTAPILRREDMSNGSEQFTQNAEGNRRKRTFTSCGLPFPNTSNQFLPSSAEVGYSDPARKHRRHETEIIGSNPTNQREEVSAHFLITIIKHFMCIRFCIHKTFYVSYNLHGFILLAKHFNECLR